MTSELKKMRPMLAATLEDQEKLQFPCFASPKLDGIRCTIRDEKPISRSGKLLPNLRLQEFADWMGKDGEGFDGELIIGDPFGQGVYKRSHSGVMTRMGAPDFRFYVFDDVTADGGFDVRNCTALARLINGLLGPKVVHLQQRLITNFEKLEKYEGECVKKGYEGIILRHPEMPYKNGRSTINQFGMVKVKRFADSEAIVTGFEELMHNANPQEMSELGYTVHSSHKANQIPMNTLGALVCATLYDLEVGTPGETHIIPNGTIFRIGTGFTANDRKEIWDNQLTYRERIAKFKFMPIGSDEKPRHPVMLGWRHPDD